MRVIVIHGAPCSGKSHYVKSHIGDNDIVYDYDKIMAALSNQPTHNHNGALQSYITDIRDIIIAKLKSETEINTAWIITTYITYKLRDQLTGLNPIYKEIKSSRRICLDRLKDNPDGRDIDKWTGYIDTYFKRTLETKDFYQSKAWQSKRIVILKRDDYQCRLCKRYGKVAAAKEVHHINPLKERWDLRLTDDNLISLCRACHDGMHDKLNNKLSNDGEDLRRRTNRMHGIKEPPLL